MPIVNDFENETGNAEAERKEEGQFDIGQRLRKLLHHLCKRFVLFVSFGPGVLGFLWLIGRLLRR